MIPGLARPQPTGDGKQKLTLSMTPCDSRKKIIIPRMGMGMTRGKDFIKGLLQKKLLPAPPWSKQREFLDLVS